MTDATTDTEPFQDVVTAIKNKGMQATVPTPGDSFDLGEARCTILGPVNPSDNNLNTYSIVIKVVFGNTKFLFAGDAQVSNETAMVAAGYDLSADVLKVGHHGSSTATSMAFLSRVNPKYAIVSCGKNFEYGLPSQSTMNNLKSYGIPVYRTDENGTNICTSDGENIIFNFNPGSYEGFGTRQDIILDL